MTTAAFLAHSGEPELKFVLPWVSLEQHLLTTVIGVMEEYSRRFTKGFSSGSNALAIQTINNPSLWEQMHNQLQNSINPMLQQIAALGVANALKQELTDNATIQTSWNLANYQAEQWAAVHSAELVTKVTENTKEALRRQVSNWVGAGGSVSDLADQIRNVHDETGGSPFGIARARLIAQTESTNAYASGNIEGWKQLGYQLPVIQPARHPGCRCYLRPGRLKDGSKVMVWHTVVDGRVCQKWFKAPWGNVAGCDGLDGRIVSGVYAGQKPGDLG